ncbi:putative glycerophosphoryl diester phosphodiesterase 2 [Acorus calamus]|uniref:glycerophosphodiester phosphodiesterase n=1 Tax=Acorus calamus TaxID=4465 RepID=A0AAV9D026_ACOCL|nr:putative glycerophosphoryl diester phosphodiesterase 2 [Acorus calamus]
MGLVADAHVQGLEVFVYGFANDVSDSYNYSYDRTIEYLQFVDNSEFSIDGVLSDFPSTASESIDI